MRQSNINIEVHLDENKVPQDIKWNASDSTADMAQSARAMMLAFWDAADKSALRIDLWTKDMPVDEMKIFFHQTLVAMSDTFKRATDDEKMTNTMKDFCDYFAEKLELVK